MLKLAGGASKFGGTGEINLGQAYENDSSNVCKFLLEENGRNNWKKLITTYSWCSCMLKLLERSKPQFFPVHKWRIFNKEAQTQKTKHTKNTQHTHAEVVATYLHFSPSVVSEHVHQVAATKTQFYKISSCAFLGLTRKGEKNGTKSTTSKVEKGTDHYLSRGGGGGVRRISFASR